MANAVTTILALFLALAVTGDAGAGAGGDTPYEAELKAAFLYNFAKFAEWPGLPGGASIVMCVLGDDAVASSLGTIIGGQAIDTHPVEVKPIALATGHTCHVLFISARVPGGTGHVLSSLGGRPTLTVSDARGFAGSGGMIELFVMHDRMRFAIDVDAVQRSPVRLSSRLFSLATIVRGEHAK